MAALLAVFGATTHAAGAATTSQVTCSTAPSTAANVNTDCDSSGNYGETSIAVNPTNHQDIVGAVIHTTIATIAGHPVPMQFIEPHVSVDGGRSWSTVTLNYAGYFNAVDPAVAFDGDGTAYAASADCCKKNDVTVSHSLDGGLTWSTPVPITVGIDGTHEFNDHPQMAAWGRGNVLVTWIHDVFNSKQQLLAAPVYDAVSHDGGRTWSTPADISGSAPFCVGRWGGAACNQTFGNAVAVSRGLAVVTFQDTYDEAPDASASLGHDTYMAVTVSPITGELRSGPALIGQEEDGILEQEYPLNPGGDQTLHDSAFALDSDGGVAADPTDPGHFALVWYDDRGASANFPLASDPYTTQTKTDIVVSQTFDGGATWSAPTAIPDTNDQFMPWDAYDSSGRLRVGFLDRSYDPADNEYGFTLATETTPGSLDFNLQELSTALSDPTQNDLPSQGTVNPAFPDPAAFVGDYTGLAADGSGVVAYWTDFRNMACQGGRCGWRSDSYFAAAP